MKTRRDNRRTPRPPMLPKAICGFPGGEMRAMYVSRLTPTHAYIRTLRPPPPATDVSVILQPVEGNPLPPISARVVSSEMDPKSSRGCGFGVVFTSMSSRAHDALCGALDRLGLKSHPSLPPASDRLVKPRVWLDPGLVARVEAKNGVLTGQVTNLSLGGALVTFGQAEDLTALAPGSTITADIVLTNVPEVLSLRAVVVRRTGPGEPRGVGIRFINLPPQTRVRIEGVLLYVLGEFFRGYRVPR